MKYLYINNNKTRIRMTELIEQEYWLGDKQFNCAYCIGCFEAGKDNCRECGFDMNQWNETEETDDEAYKAEFQQIWNTICDCDALKDFNGHFWIEKDGEVLDDYPWYIELNDFKTAFGIKNKKAKLEYERCDEEATNRIIFGMWKRTFEKSGKTEAEIKEMIGKVWTKPQKLCCYFNSTARQQNIGGKIVFGSVFMRSDRGNKKHYICGLPNAKTFYDFKKAYDPFETL